MSALVAAFVTAVILALSSYLDYRVASFRRRAGRGASPQPLAWLGELPPVTPLPWLAGGLAIWLLVVSALSGTVSFLIAGLIILTAIALFVVIRNLLTGDTAAAYPSSRLTGLAGELAGMDLLLRGPEIRIGREENNTVVLSSLGVSRHHARIVATASGFILEDVGSQAGTFVNDRPIRQATLRDGDEIRIDNDRFRFRTAPPT